MFANSQAQTIAPACLEALEDRVLYTATSFGYWPKYLGMDKIISEFPALNGGGNNVAVIDSGIDTLNVGLGARPYWKITSPRVMTVANFSDYASTPERIFQKPVSGHGTGVASILAGVPFEYGGYKYQGILQNSTIYNLQYDQANAQQSIKEALHWVMVNHAKYNITAVDLTDFVGTLDSVPAYAGEVRALWDAGVFIATPVANNWDDPAVPHGEIGFPAKDSHIFGIGGMLEDGTMTPATQRGPGLDLLAPANHVVVAWYVPETGEEFYRGRGTGNSFGTPYVVGTAMLMQQINPDLSPADIMQILQNSGVKVTDPSGTGTYSRLDMYAAIKMTYRLSEDIYAQGLRPNYTMARAATIPLKRGGGGISNMKLLVGAPDWYTFSITGSATATISSLFSDAGQSGTFALYNAKGKYLGQSGASSLSVRLGTGRYYIRASSAQTVSGTYSLTVRFTP